MYGLTLEQAPPYSVPLIYYLTGMCYLLLFCIGMLVFGFDVQSRYEIQAVALTHLMTLGFFTHIMFGTLFQMIPVIVAEAYKKVEIYSKILLVTLNTGIIFFIFSLLLTNPNMSIAGGVLLVFSLLFFSLYSLKTVMRTKDKNSFVKTLASALFFLIFCTAFGAISLMQLSGFVSGTWIADIHIEMMIFGWVFLLFTGVSYKILSMFYVAREYPLVVKNYLYLSVSILLVLLFLFTIFDVEYGKIAVNVTLAMIVAGFSSLSIYILKTRKRARKDVTVNLFYFANINLLAGALIWMLSIIFDLHVEIILGVLFGLGFVYGIMNAMLYKIVPFLTWFHLSSSFVMEAEMGDVISVKWMKIQYYLFLVSYLSFLFFYLFHPLFFIAVGTFLISAVVLFYNLVNAFFYYKKMIKKAVRYD